MQRRHRTDSEKFWVVIFGTLIWREDIPQKGSNNKCQPNARNKIVLFYRNSKKRRSFCQQPYQLQIKMEYIRSNVSIANKNRIHQIIYTWTVLTRRQAQLIINQFNHININQPFHIEAVNYVLIPFEGNINHGDPTEIKLFLQATKEIDK